MPNQKNKSLKETLASLKSGDLVRQPNYYQDETSWALNERSKEKLSDFALKTGDLEHQLGNMQAWDGQIAIAYALYAIGIIALAAAINVYLIALIPIGYYGFYKLQNREEDYGKVHAISNHLKQP